MLQAKLLPVRLQLQDNPAFSAVVEKASEAVRLAEQHADISFGQLLDAGGLPEPSKHAHSSTDGGAQPHPLFQAAFLHSDELSKAVATDLQQYRSSQPTCT